MLNHRLARAACALPAVALAAAALTLAPSAASPPTARPPVPEASPTQDDEASAGPDDQFTATIVIRYDADVIYLTPDLLNALCRSSVKVDPPEGSPEWTEAEGSLPFMVTASAWLDRQPPGVFAGRASIYARGLTDAAREEAMTAALGALEEALAVRLHRTRERELQERSDRLERVTGVLREELSEVTRQRENRARRAEIRERLRTLEQTLAALEVEVEVSSQDFRVSRSQVEEAEAEVALARAQLEAAEARLRRTTVLAENGSVSSQEVHEAEAAVLAARGSVNRATAKLQQSTARLAANEARRVALDQQREQTRTSVEARSESLALLDGEFDGDPAGSEAAASVREMSLRDRLAATERALAEVGAELESLVPVTITRW